MVGNRTIAIFISLFLISSIFITSISAENRENHINAPLIKVLFDNTKHETAGNADWTTDGAFSDFATAIKRNFTAQVDQANTGPITSTILAPYNVYIIPEAQNPFTSAESLAIRQWVLQGGGLLFVADHTGSDRDSDGWDSPHIYNTFLNTTIYYGILFNYDDKSQDPINHVDNSSMIPDVKAMGYWDGCTLGISGNATAHIWLNSGNGGGATVATSTYGNGRIAALGDSSVFDDGTSDKNNTGDTLYDGWHSDNDSQLGVDLVRFLKPSGSVIEFQFVPMFCLSIIFIALCVNYSRKHK